MESIQMRNRNTMLFWVILLVLAAIAAMPLMENFYYSMTHAVEGHGSDAILSYRCSIGSDNLIQKWQRPHDGRIAWICDTPKGFAVVIEEADGNLVTAFIKEKMKEINQVMRYLRNGGYEQLW